jgi:hypothetical protein
MCPSSRTLRDGSLTWLALKVLKMLVKPMKAGVTTTVLIDCCHSGTVLDLPYTYAAGDNHMKREERFNMEIVTESVRPEKTRRIKPKMKRMKNEAIVADVVEPLSTRLAETTMAETKRENAPKKEASVAVEAIHPMVPIKGQISHSTNTVVTEPALPKKLIQEEPRVASHRKLKETTAKMTRDNTVVIVTEPAWSKKLSIKEEPVRTASPVKTKEATARATPKKLIIPEAFRQHQPMTPFKANRFGE